jgi:TonB family protein
MQAYKNLLWQPFNLREQRLNKICWLITSLLAGLCSLLSLLPNNQLPKPLSPSHPLHNPSFFMPVSLAPHKLQPAPQTTEKKHSPKLASLNPAKQNATAPLGYSQTGEMQHTSESQNLVEASAPVIEHHANHQASHGPILIDGPLPSLPDHMRTALLETFAVIEFMIPAQGPLLAQIFRSTGHLELDGLILRTVKTWQFEPAFENHKPIDSRIRLKVRFKVQ